jgi:hypothetical protein
MTPKYSVVDLENEVSFFLMFIGSLKDSLPELEI